MDGGGKLNKPTKHMCVFLFRFGCIQGNYVLPEGLAKELPQILQILKYVDLIPIVQSLRPCPHSSSMSKNTSHACEKVADLS